jgi:RNA polymerase sigma factor (sigma-70 family)
LRDADQRKAEMVRLVEPQIPVLRRYARMLVKDWSVADDLVQDCLERTFAHWHLRRPDRQVKPWMLSILHNLAMNHFSRSKWLSLHTAIDDVDESALARPASQESTVGYNQVLAAIDSLPEELRSLFLLIAVEELSYAEAASVLDIPVGTVMSRLHRARARLQGMLGGGPVLPAAQSLRGVR